MALTTTITKKSISQSQEGLFAVTFNMLYKDGTTVLVDQDFTENYWRSGPWVVIKTKFLERMKARIQQYKDEQTVWTAAGMDSMVTNLNAQVGV